MGEPREEKAGRGPQKARRRRAAGCSVRVDGATAVEEAGEDDEEYE